LNLTFAKYQGAANDFIILDHIANDISAEVIQQFCRLCERRTGIGADGVLIISRAEKYDYHMQIFNPDGREADFCGNGARCLLLFARDRGYVEDEADFSAGDGSHEARYNGDNMIAVTMQPVYEYENLQGLEPLNGYNGVVLNSGVDHLVIETEALNEAPLLEIARRYRPDGSLLPTGVNVNLFENNNGQLSYRTFEKGVEAETHACGTGAVAVAYRIWREREQSGNIITLQTRGGELSVDLNRIDKPILCGPAFKVYEGRL
jgi:diaminopimelate epimerase